MMRFTIRDVLWLTALVAMGVAWSAERRRRDTEWETVNTYTSDHFDRRNPQPCRVIVEQREKRVVPNPLRRKK